MAASSNTTIKLESVDGKIFTVKLEVAKMSKIITEMVANCEESEEETEERPVPLNVTGDILEKVVQWCEHNYGKEGTSDEEDGQWNKVFLDVSNEVLYAIVRAANYLDIEGLLQLSTKAVAEQMKGKTPPEIRDFFGWRV